LFQRASHPRSAHALEIFRNQTKPSAGSPEGECKGFQNVKKRGFALRVLNFENVKLLLPFVQRVSFACPCRQNRVPDHPDDS